MALQLRDKFGRPVRDLRISVIDKCNFRCPYCMPAEIFGADYNFLSKPELLSNDELFRLARLFVDLGVTKLRITGGEPLLRPQLPELISRLTALEGVDDVALTTNAFYLRKHAQALKSAGLSRLTISLDSLDDEVFRQLNGFRSGVAEVLDGMAAAIEAGFEQLKINCVVKRGVNDHTIVDLARHFKGSGHIVRYIEYMDVGNLNGWRLDDVVTQDEILALIDAEFPLEAVPPNYPGEVANRFRYADGSGEIGVIASVTKPFCGNCTRARLSSAGEYYTCLFGVEGADLRAPLRSGATDDEIREMIAGVWRHRVDQYSELRTSFTQLPAKGAEMYRLGG
ncbi:MAG: GTP 3',8-cyclase MoaA [Anaerolineales bacterium]|nr:GTP 3',8-cyclase MoaA [Anaerolineales bacterium]MCB0007064.1 GTP 3',8-cyclase MoaA [Anaerolineales bacterium]MCB8962503.1 GTP 3',8-cyclase MoaA [Ardenticatenales bacterium]